MFAVCSLEDRLSNLSKKLTTKKNSYLAWSVAYTKESPFIWE